MPPKYKGIPKLYDNVLSFMEGDWTFYEWLDLNCDLQPGQICCAPAWYEKKKRWYFHAANYDKLNESNSTWFAKEYSAERSRNKNTDNNVNKFFGLESDENLIATAGKYRPIVLLKYYETEWWSKTYPNNSWLCFPIFEYKTSRHNQDYVLNDLSLQQPDRFYLPPQYCPKIPGINNESAVLLQSIQVIEQKYIYPLECCKNNESQKYFKLSEKALKLVFYHFIQNIHLLDIFMQAMHVSEHDETNEYECFKIYIQDLISKLD